jgi:histidinol-phosphate aminotransferase
VPLAIDSYGELKALGDSASLLNLAWTIDERQCIGINLDDLITAELEAESSEGLPFVSRYLVDDPYGERLLVGPVRAYFAISDWSPCIVSGAGVISLLQALAALTRDALVHVAGNTYPDFPHWIHVAGGAHASQPDNADLIFLERPSLIGDQLADLDEVRKLCLSASDRGAIVLVDESNANYRSPAFSAVNLMPGIDNLIVLRGMSKGYGMGGLRLGIGIASEGLQARIRQVVPPLLASSLSLRIGAQILTMGDVAEPLRERIRVNREEAKVLLMTAGFKVVDASEGFPYLFLQGDPVEVLPELKIRGILGKSHMVWSSADEVVKTMPRVSVPLAGARMEILRKALGAHDLGRR